MVEMALVFVGLTLLVLLGLFVSTVYFVPLALADEHDDESEDVHGGPTH